jgi:hypothetical protein
LHTDLRFIIWLDYLLVPIFLLFVYLIFSATYFKGLQGKQKFYFKLGFLLKIFGALAHAMIYQYYYGKAGDVIVYYDTGYKIYDYLFKDIGLYIKLVFGDASPDNINYINVVDDIILEPSNYFVPRVVGFLSLFTGGTILPIAILTATFSFLCIAKLVKDLVLLYPAIEQYVYVAFFLVPSVFLWGSGPIKDTFTFAALCLYISAAINIFVFKKKLILNILLLVLGIKLLLVVKSYIFYCSFLFLAIYLFLHVVKQLKGALLKLIFIGFFMLLISAVGIYFISNIGEIWNELVLSLFKEKFISSSKGLQNTEAGSKYDLGINFESLDNISNIIRYFFPAVNVSLHRPYIWEAKSIIALFSAVESFACLIIAIYVLIKGRIVGVFSVMGKHPFMIFCIGFVLFFSFIVGLSSGNFGTLVRYKIPAIPFYLLFLFISLYAFKQKKLLKKNIDLTVH